LTRYFDKITEGEAPYPWRSMVEKLDPIIMEEWEATLTDMQIYAAKILQLTGEYDDKLIKQLCEDLVLTPYTHNFVIDYEYAEKLKLKVIRYSKFKEEWRILKAWLESYLLTNKDRHIIRYVLPVAGAKNG